MELYQRKRGGAWYVDLVDPSTQERVRKSTKRTTKREAEVVARRLLADLEVADGKKPITLRAALDGYAGSLRSAGKASAEGAGSLRDKTLGLRPGERFTLDPERMLHTLAPADLEAIVQARYREGAAAQTIAHEIKNIRAAAKRAVELRFRGPSLEKWRIPSSAPKLRYLTTEEFWRLYDYMDPLRPIQMTTRAGMPGSTYIPAGRRLRQRRDARDILVALTMTGMRWGEAAALTWEQVDLPGSLIRVFGSKTDAERVVGIPEPLAEVLTTRLEDRGESPRVFPAVDPDERRGGSCRPILRAMDAVGLNRPDLVKRYGRATVHSLRHTFASWALQNGATLAEVQYALGHTTLQMTKRYAHLEQTPTASKLAGLLGAALSDRSPSGQTDTKWHASARETPTTKTILKTVDESLSAMVIQMPVRRVG